MDAKYTALIALCITFIGILINIGQFIMSRHFFIKDKKKQNEIDKMQEIIDHYNDSNSRLFILEERFSDEMKMLLKMERVIDEIKHDVWKQDYIETGNYPIYKKDSNEH